MRTRQQFDEAVKDEVAHGWYYRLLTSKEIEARGIQMGNVYRWMTERFGSGQRPPKGTAPPPPKNGAQKNVVAPEPSDAALELESLSRRKIKRGANGRYPDGVREKLTPLLLREVPVPEIAEKTGINSQTLYLWRDAAKKKSGAAPTESAGALVVAPSKPSQVATIRKAEILVNPDSTEQLLVSIRRSEGFVNLKKVVENRTAAYRAGLIDFDEDDHRLCMSYLQLAGGGVRGARK